MVTFVVASKYTGVFNALGANWSTAPGATVMLVHLKMPSAGMVNVVLLVMVIGP
jgi:hypothetical protein